MAEGLAVAASIIAVVQIVDKVITLCGQFVGKVRGADKEIFHVITTITALKGILEFLHRFVQNDEDQSRFTLLHSLCDLNGPLEICQKVLEDIAKKLPSANKDHIRTSRAITWPWKGKGIWPDLDIIEKQKTLIILAMQGDTAQAVQSIHSTEKQLRILKWVSDVDFYLRHDAVSGERVENSGIWFWESEPFQNWLNGNSSNLLCYKGIRKFFA